MTTTAADVKQAFAALVEAHRQAGITRTVTVPISLHADWHEVTLTADDLVLQEGSVTYGRGYAVFYKMPGSGGLYEALHMGSLGTTRAEAERALRGIVAGMYAVLDAQRVSA